MKVLIIEDNRIINNNISRYLKIEWFYVESVFDWKTGFEKATQNDYDVILLDLMIPVIDGVTLCKMILQQKKIPIIMITAKDTIEDRIIWLDSWADDYIVKPFDLWELTARIYAVLRRWNKEIYEKIVFNDVEIDLQKREIYKNHEKVNLTLKEFLIMEYLLKNPSKAVSRTDILSYVWWWDEWMFESDYKLDVYISNLRKKLDKDLIETIKWFWYRINM